jgi:hypothetical protein
LDESTTGKPRRRSGSVGFWPMKLRERPPVIPIPLKPEDPDAVLDLQQLLHETFDAAGYADYIYQGKPRPPLHPEDDAWAKTARAAAEAQ